MASSPITSWQIDRKKVETVIDFIFLGSKITEDGDYSHEIKRCLLLGRKAMTSLSSHSVMYDSLQPHGPQHARLPCPSPNLLKLMSIESVMPSHNLILCCPLLPMPSIFPSISVFKNRVSTSHQVAKVL